MADSPDAPPPQNRACPACGSFDHAHIECPVLRSATGEWPYDEEDDEPQPNDGDS